MTNFDVEARTIYKCVHGSRAYGTSTPTSDLDVKGVCIEPAAYHLGFLSRFEQHERMQSKGNDHDLVIYSLKKFAKLAADCNPNIIEVLFVDDADVLFIDDYGDELRDNRKLFLSKKARWTFAGYAHAQLKRIKTHRAWLLNPPKQPPTREEFGLPATNKVSKSELGLFENSLQKGTEITLPKDVYTLFMKERTYLQAVTQWQQYENWRMSRNPARAQLEAKFGYDTKHGLHLIRLMRMCKEILTTGEVLVKRPDAEELLRIRAGDMSYDALVEEAETLEAECAALYETSTVLPKTPDLHKLDKLVVSVTESYLANNG